MSFRSPRQSRKYEEENKPALAKKQPATEYPRDEDKIPKWAITMIFLLPENMQDFYFKLYILILWNKYDFFLHFLSVNKEQIILCWPQIFSRHSKYASSQIPEGLKRNSYVHHTQLPAFVSSLLPLIWLHTNHTNYFTRLHTSCKSRESLGHCSFGKTRGPIIPRTAFWHVLIYFTSRNLQSNCLLETSGIRYAEVVKWILNSQLMLICSFLRVFGTCLCRISSQWSCFAGKWLFGKTCF